MIRGLLGATILLAPFTLRSQTTATLDAGSARMRFSDSIDATALSLSPAASVKARRGSLRGFGTFARLSDGWSNSGTLDGSLTTPSAGYLSGELEGIAGGSLHSDGARTGQMLAFARLHLANSTRGTWIGGGVGRTWDGVWRGVRQGDVGAWILRGASTFAASLAPTTVGDTIRFVDTYFAAHHLAEPWELDGSLGFRAGGQLPTLPANRTVWGSIGAILWASPRVGLVARAGAYPIDFTQGFPGGQFVSLAVRLRAAQPATLAPVAAVAAPVEGVSRFETRRVATSGDMFRIRIYAPAARSADITGDFTNWTPVALTSEGRGWWAATLPIRRGTHQLNVRVNGGPWGVPPGLIALKDEFAGVVGLLAIE